MEFLKHNVDYVIIGILGLMSFVVVWLTIERLIFYAYVKFENYKNQGILPAIKMSMIEEKLFNEMFALKSDKKEKKAE